MGATHRAFVRDAGPRASDFREKCGMVRRGFEGKQGKAQRRMMKRFEWRSDKDRARSKCPMFRKAKGWSVVRALPERKPSPQSEARGLLRSEARLSRSLFLFLNCERERTDILSLCLHSRAVNALRTWTRELSEDVNKRDAWLRRASGSG